VKPFIKVIEDKYSQYVELLSIIMLEDTPRSFAKNNLITFSDGNPCKVHFRLDIDILG